MIHTSISSYLVLLQLRKKNDQQIYQKLISRDGTVVMDTLESQLEEVYHIRHPASILNGVIRPDVKRFIDTCYQEAGGKAEFGVWAWYPWRKTLIHFLPELMHTELRTSRNRNLITESEQRRYYESVVGVAGLSVGNAVVSNLVHTGGAKHIRIADGDMVSGSNTNRIRTGFESVGILKTTLIRREIYLTNPYADVSEYPHGLTKRTIEQFLLQPTPLRVVVDEMDNLYLKIQLRLIARAHKIPVVMAADNGDGVVVDIERYDLDSNAPLMHGDIPEKELRAIRQDTPRHIAAKIISTWVKPENITERMMESLMELGSTLYTWPQLGNAAAMAGSVMSYVVRRIVLDQPIARGKIIVSPDALFIPEYSSKEAHEKRRLLRTRFIT